MHDFAANFPCPGEVGAPLPVRLVIRHVQVENPFGRNSDLMGMAFAWSKAQDKTLAEQSVFEIFYRLQLTPNTQITPDFQVILHPSKAPEKDAVAVFGIRLRVAY